jgi:hypothetical protein
VSLAWSALGARPVWAQPGESEAAAEAAEADEPEKPAPTEDTGLPENYQPPGEIPDEIVLEKNLMTPEEREEFKKKSLSSFRSKLRSGDFRTDELKDLIRRGIRYQLDELTIAAKRRELPKIRDRFVNQHLRNAGAIANLKADQLRDFRSELLSMVTEETAKLFDNNLYVRIQAAILLGELNLVEGDPAKGVKAEAFAPAAKPLDQVLLDPKQFEGVKLAAVLSLTRILRKGNPNAALKQEIASALISELKRDPKETHPWYQARLAEALGAVDVSLDLDRQPFVYNALDAVLNDQNRALGVRIQAAWSLGRHPIPPGVNLTQLANDIAAVGLALAKDYERNPAAPSARRQAVTLYLAFQAKDAEDMDATRQHKGGLLNLNPAPPAAAAAEIKETYQQLLPIVVPILYGQRIAPEQVQTLEKYVQSKPPKSPKPEGQPVGNTGAAAKNVNAAVGSR